MFFNTAFDIVFSVILGICAVLLLSGKGDFILIKMRSKADREKPLSYDKKKLGRVMGIWCLVMLVAELIMIFFGKTQEFWSALVVMIVVAIALIVGVFYLRKCARVEPERTEIPMKKEKSIRDRINALEQKNRV